MMIVFESLFLLHMLSKFILTYNDPITNVKEKSPRKIMKNYIATEFKWDLIPLVPLQLIPMERHRNTLFFIIKTVRLFNINKLLDVGKIVKGVRGCFKKYAEWEKCDCMEEDHVRIQEILLIGYLFKILRLVIIILNLAQIVAMFWLIYCKLVEDLVLDADFGGSAEDREKHPDTFIVAYELHAREPLFAEITVLYFAFTTLSTVGFGDYVPKSSDERIVGTFILLFGVAIFSIIMSSFVGILSDFMSYNAEHSDGRLSGFFNILKKFNNGMEVEAAFQAQVEAHFDYKWRTDRNYPFVGD